MTHTIVKKHVTDLSGSMAIEKRCPMMEHRRRLCQLAKDRSVYASRLSEMYRLARENAVSSSRLLDGKEEIEFIANGALLLDIMSEVNINRSKSVKMSPINVFISKSTKTMFDTTDTCSVCPSIGQHDGMPGMAQKCLAEELHQPDSTYGVYPYTGQHDGTTGMVQNCPIEEIHQSDSNCFSYMKCISINGDSVKSSHDYRMALSLRKVPLYMDEVENNSHTLSAKCLQTMWTNYLPDGR